jgi:hypothetical protein
MVVMQEASMSGALAQSAPIPVGVVKRFGPYGPEYEVLGPSEPGKSMVRIVLVRTGEEVTYEYDSMMQYPEAR